VLKAAACLDAGFVAGFPKVKAPSTGGLSCRFLSPEEDL